MKTPLLSGISTLQEKRHAMENDQFRRKYSHFCPDKTILGDYCWIIFMKNPHFCKISTFLYISTKSKYRDFNPT